MKYFILIPFLIIFNFIYALSNDGEKLANEILNEYKKIKSFEADIAVKIDINYLNAPEKKGKIYYQSPNNTKVDIEGFSMLPKQGTGNFIAEILSMKSTFIYVGETKLNNENLVHLKVIPNNSKEIVLVDMYIDNSKKIVKKADITTKENGTFYISLDYKNFSGFFLPSLVNIEFVVPNFKMPKAFVGPRDKNKVDEMQKDGETTKGKVILKYWNYLVNNKIDKSIFDKK